MLLGFACLLCAPARGAERVSLDGAWRHWLDGQNYVPVQVPFTNEPVDGATAYQKIFTVPPGLCGGQVLLRFDGVAGAATVYLNGVELGQHGPYTPFWFTVSSLLNPDGANDLTVLIDDHRDNTTVPYEDIPWVNYSGIMRSVYLECADDAMLLAVEPQYDLSGGLTHVDGEVFVQAAGTPGRAVSFAGALLDGSPGNWTTVALLDPAADVPVGPDGLAAATLAFSADGIELWSPDAPRRYTLYVVAEVGGRTADARTVQTGFREIRVEGKDIFLNGEPFFLKGISRHNLYFGTGFVGTDAQILEDMQRFKAMGVNYVRTIHFPTDPRVLDLADSMGLLVSEEVPAWANFWDPNVREKLYSLLKDMIHRDMHHPSVFLWVMGNARAHPMPYTLEARNLAKALDRNRLVSYVIDNDEYTPDVIAQDVAFFHEARLDLYMKISWWFYYLEYLQDAWANFPKDLPIVIAEFGREGNDREPITIDGDSVFWWGEDQQADAIAEMLEAWRPHLPPYDADAHITGMVLFNYQDFDWPNIQRHLPNHVPSVHHGIVYEDRVPKLAFQTLADFYTTLPTTFVGLPTPDDAEVEQLFVAPAGLGPVVNHAFRESGPSLSADGQTLYFVSDGPDHVQLPKIFFSEQIDGQWGAPQLLDIPQETEPFAFRGAPCISPDGQTLYFTRALVSGIYVARTRIWQSQRVNGVWTQPVDLGDVVNHPDAARVTTDAELSADGNTLFFSSDRPGGQGRSDLWMSRKVNAAWTAPVNLGSVINSEYSETGPSVSADGLTMYFSSDRPGGVGSSDIWVSHYVNGSWTKPKNLGPELNSPGSDREPDVSTDGERLFFTGSRSGGEGLSDVWSARSACSRPTTLSLDGPWQHFLDATTSEPIVVPFSREPTGTIDAYQRIFTVPASVCPDLALLRFDGLVGAATVYLNGVELGRHGSYTPFWFDVTGQVNVGGPNELVVELNDFVDLSSIPAQSTWVNYTGIHRSVYLEFGRAANILSTTLQYGFSGGLSRADGEVTVRSAGPAGTNVSFTGALYDGDVGAAPPVAVLIAATDVPVGPDGVASAALAFSVDNPQLWSPENPKLYTLHVTATVAGQTADKHEVRVGFREIRTEGNNILLNGQPILLKGACRHDVYPSTGYIGTEQQMVDDMASLKAAGLNYVRLIHYPAHPRILELADEMGLLVSEELPAWANFWDPDVQTRLYAMFEEMFHRDGHHPSLVLWITGTSPTRPTPYGFDASQVVKGMDRTRLVSFVIDDPEHDEATLTSDTIFFLIADLDLLMKNAYWPVYQYVEVVHDAWPRFPKDIPVVIAEFGQEGSDTQPLYTDGTRDVWLHEDQQAADLRTMLEAWRPHLPYHDADEHISGLVLFNYQDIPWPIAPFAWPGHLQNLHFGMVRQDRTVKAAYDTLAAFHTNLPGAFVGPPTVSPEEVEAIFGNPTNLGPTINNGLRVGAASISADGQTLYFAADEETTPFLSGLFVTYLVDGAWAPPNLVAMPPDPDPDAFRDGPCISYDGQTLYFTRLVFDVGRITQARIYQATRVGEGWTAPVDLGDVVNYPDPARTTSDPSVSADGTKLFFSSDRPGGFGGMDIWMSEWIGGVWTEPVNLGSGVNTPYHEREPTLASNGLGLAFASDRPGGMGNHDIWVSHFSDGVWIPSKNLGPGVNSAGDDRDPEVAKDDASFYFAGIRDENLGLSDLWVTSVPVAEPEPAPVPVGTPGGLMWMGAGLLAAGLATLRGRARRARLSRGRR